MPSQLQIHNLAESLRNCGSHFAVAITGGGAPVCTSLFFQNGVGGAESFMVDFQAPWGEEASNRLFLRGYNETFPMYSFKDFKMPPPVSLYRALYMARGIHTTNNCLGPNQYTTSPTSLITRRYPKLWGIALTAKLSPTSSEENCCAELCAYSPGKVHAWNLKFSPIWDRADQELSCAEAIINIMRFLAGIDVNPCEKSSHLSKYEDHYLLGLSI